LLQELQQAAAAAEAVRHQLSQRCQRWSFPTVVALAYAFPRTLVVAHSPSICSHRLPPHGPHPYYLAPKWTLASFSFL